MHVTGIFLENFPRPGSPPTFSPKHKPQPAAMPKRKRNAEPTLNEKLEKHQVDIARALKTSKGLERQRLSKRQHEKDVPADKAQRLEREIAVLKSLDLHQTAIAHLSSSLLKVKSISASTDLPEEIRAGVPKPELSEEEKAALHNVTSGLFNRKMVKEAVDRAVVVVCEALNVPPPQKGKQGKKNKREEQEEQAENRITTAAETEGVAGVGGADGYDDVTDFEGFQSDVDEPGPAVGEASPGEDSADESEDSEEEASKLDHLLGCSSDSDSDDLSALERFRGTETVNLDDISSGSESDDNASSPPLASPSRSPSPPPAKKKKPTKPTEPARPTESSFYSLLGGYVSGSESASDIEVEAPKKRRGQRARQKIWEKKYGSGAKHLHEQKNASRDSGWDMKRGAVDGDDQGRRTPWKKGVSNPFAKGSREGSAKEAKPQKIRSRDDEGQLHASWEAAKKAKEAQKGAAFAGSKITFD